MFGLMIYYLLPKGLINQDITLLLFVFFIILEGLLIGMVLIGFSFQYLLEKVVAYGLLFWINSTDFMLMLKNLSAHRFKNRRSAILYAFSVAFIVFVSVGIQIQIQTIYNELLKKHGSFVEVEGLNLNRTFYDDVLKRTEGVEDWAYQTVALDKYLKSKQNVSKIMVSDRARLYFAENQIFGVSPNILNTWYADKVPIILISDHPRKDRHQVPLRPLLLPVHSFRPQHHHAQQIRRQQVQHPGRLESRVPHERLLAGQGGAYTHELVDSVLETGCAEL